LAQALILQKGNAMTITVEATYENGVLRPSTPLALAENEKVTLTILPARRVAQDSYGLLGWQGDPEILRQVAMDPDLEYDQ
jgi:predicted DNA-binding antitoxin AbrB/MazE fold protein